MSETTAASYVARGLTNEIRTCEHCGTRLKIAVLLARLDADGNVIEGLRTGVVCAARLTGRPAEKINAEAKAADRQARSRRARMEGFRHRNTHGLVKLVQQLDRVPVRHPHLLAEVREVLAERGVHV